ncbi:unnamed protein product, partial [marine sediment metagenome]
ACSSSKSGSFTVEEAAVVCPQSSATCSSPDGSIACGGTKSGCLYKTDWKYYSVPSSAGKEVTVTLTMSGTGCNSNDLYIYDSSCASNIYISGGNLWTETWTGTPSTDIIIGIDGDSSNENCLWDLSVTCAAVNQPPSISSVTDSPDPVTAGNSIAFTANWSDPDSGDQTKLHICKTNSISGQTCSGGSWCDTTSWDTTSPSSCSYTTGSGDVGSHSYYAFICDDDNVCSSSKSGSFTVEEAAVGEGVWA